MLESCQVQNQERSDSTQKGLLKIFFGYAAGVGKTYAMLKAAHQAQNRGVDVVVGYIERHTRPDTLALLEGLEQLPEKIVEYKGIALREMDLDAALQRRPNILLVDELAHSNAAGCRHSKRYQDVEELLHAGISVYTTVNVQHLESLNDLVASITHIAVSERIPDSIFDSADQVELVDIEPDDLILRLQSGKFQGAQIRVRTGVYFIDPGCVSASLAIDAANYARKQVEHHSPVSIRVYDETLRKKQQLENEIVNGIDAAMKEQRFQVYLQPKISLTTGEVVGAEALVRWMTSEGTLLNPDVFIPLFESSGRIEELDFYVFERVAEFLSRNQKLGRKQVPISVNASILHASDPFAVQKYLNILKKYQVDPKYTEVELTETATVKEYESARRWFRELREAGIHTALDDFGAGYSILNSVIDIPVDTVKLDRAFIRNCELDSRGIFFLHKLISMIKGLGYHVVCEGVETKNQFDIIRDSGCEEVQGFLFSKPLPLDEYEKFVYHTGQEPD